MNVTLIGGGGAKFTFDLPLHPVIAEQVEKGQLQPFEAKDRQALTEPEVPDGTAAQILEWVGNDPDRAAQALEAEQGRDKPRSTLIATLEDIGG